LVNVKPSVIRFERRLSRSRRPNWTNPPCRFKNADRDGESVAFWIKVYHAAPGAIGGRAGAIGERGRDGLRGYHGSTGHSGALTIALHASARHPPRPGRGSGGLC